MTTIEIADRRRWLVMAAVGVGVFLSTVDGSIVNVALPTLVRELDAPLATAQWVVLAYLVGVTALMVSVGRLADMLGRKRIYVLGFITFTTGSVLCGLAPGIETLIACRILQAVGAAMVLPLGTAIVTAAFPARERGLALGLVGAIVSLGIIVGPTLGGLIVSALSWRWIFFVNLPVGVLGTIMAAVLVPADRPAGGQRFDVQGGVALVCTLLCVLGGLTFVQRSGTLDTWAVAAFACGLACGAWFAVAERRSADPLLDLDLFRDRYFAVSLGTGFLSFVAVAGTMFLAPFYLQNVLGYDPRRVGMALAVVPIGLGLMAPVSGTLSDRAGTERITVAGLAVLLLGLLAMSTLGPAPAAATVVLCLLPVGIGMGIFQSPNNSSVMGRAPANRLGVVAGLLALTRTMGQTAGIALVATVWTVRTAHRAGASGALDPTAASPAAQANAFGDAALVMAAVVTVAVALAGWRLSASRRGR